MSVTQKQEPSVPNNIIGKVLIEYLSYIQCHFPSYLGHMVLILSLIYFLFKASLGCRRVNGSVEPCRYPPCPPNHPPLLSLLSFHPPDSLCRSFRPIGGACRIEGRIEGGRRWSVIKILFSMTTLFHASLSLVLSTPPHPLPLRPPVACGPNA